MTGGRWIAAALLLCVSVPVAVAQFDSRASAAEQYVPQLGDLMNAAQSRHMKLYFAGKAQNWELAAYELERLKATLVEAAVLYGGIPVTNVTTMAAPLQAVQDAIEAKDSRKFAGAVGGLTDGCNACHQSMNRAFIVIRQPTEQPFGNQVFAPQKTAK